MIGAGTVDMTWQDPHERREREDYSAGPYHDRQRQGCHARLPIYYEEGLPIEDSDLISTSHTFPEDGCLARG